MTELLLLRHSIAEGNQDKRYLGCRTDTLLRPEGEALAQEKAAKLPPCQALYTSSMLRALQTGCILFPDLEPEIIPGMEEMDFGDFEGKKQSDIAELPEYIEWIKGGMDACPPNGEKFGDFSLRCISGLDVIFSDMMAKDVTRAAVVTHGGVITNLLSGYGLPKGRPADYMCGPGEGFEIILSTFLWQKGPAFEISGRII